MEAGPSACCVRIEQSGPPVLLERDLNFADQQLNEPKRQGRGRDGAVSSTRHVTFRLRTSGHRETSVRVHAVLNPTSSSARIVTILDTAAVAGRLMIRGLSPSVGSTCPLQEGGQQ